MIFIVHLIKILGWSDTDVSILSGAWGTLIVIAVVLIGGWIADRVGARYLLIVVIFIHASYMLIANLFEPYWSKRPVATAILILWNMMDPILSTASMPVLMSLCRKHVEGNHWSRV
jgi:PAT family beta-lactamase induction signal transducer AmpG